MHPSSSAYPATISGTEESPRMTRSGSAATKSSYRRNEDTEDSIRDYDLCFLRAFCKFAMHPLYQKADRLSSEVIGAAIEVHRDKGPGLIESIYERCMLRELQLRSIPATTQKLVRVEYKGLVFDEPLRFDLLVNDCLLVELKAVEILHPSSKAQLLSYMKLLDIPIGLLINFHEPLLKNGISRMILPGVNQTEDESKDISL